MLNRKKIDWREKKLEEGTLQYKKNGLQKVLQLPISMSKFHLEDISIQNSFFVCMEGSYFFEFHSFFFKFISFNYRVLMMKT